MNGRADPPERGSDPARAPHDFEAIYASSTPPWEIGRPQPAFVRLADAGGFVGRVLDVGCGTGEHALLAASLGHDSLGVDIAPNAVDLAREKATHRHLNARFVVWNALRLPEMDEQFDTVLDCGLFHIFDNDDRTRFVESLAAVVPASGRYHMLCFSDREPGDWGPRRVTQEEIRTSFSDGWRLDTIEASVIDITIDPAGAEAWYVAATRD
jgi:SAM-dependent methyltransferase